MIEPDTICLNCSHSWKNHESLFGFQMGCDIELSWGDGIQLCGCNNFVPVVLAERAEVN